MVTPRKSLLFAALFLLPVPGAEAQDPFEIQVYEYVTTPKGRWNLETHFNYTARGTRIMEGTAAPSEGQTHLTFELTRGTTTSWPATCCSQSDGAMGPIWSAGASVPGFARRRAGTSR